MYLKLNELIIATGFPFQVKQDTESYMKFLVSYAHNAPMCVVQVLPAIDLAYVDYFFEIGLKNWDIATDYLLASEADGTVTYFTGNNEYLISGNIIAGSPKVTSTLVKKLVHY